MDKKYKLELTKKQINVLTDMAWVGAREELLSNTNEEAFALLEETINYIENKVKEDSVMTVKELIEELKKLDPELEVVCLNSETMDGETMTSNIGFGETKMYVPKDLRKYKRYDDPIPNGQTVVFIYG